MNNVTQKYTTILHFTEESTTLLWTFKLLMRACETRNSLNACFTPGIRPSGKMSIIVHGYDR